MKKIIIKVSLSLLTLMVLLCNTANAQVDSLRQKLDHVFQHIDKSQIPTGYLKEYGMEFANLATYNGVLTDSNVVDAMAWHYIYASVFSAKIENTAQQPSSDIVLPPTVLPTPETNYEVFNTAAVNANGVNPVSMLLLNYSSIKPTAMEENLFTITNEQLYDVPNRTQSPYLVNTAFAAAPFYNVDNDGVLKLIFKSNLFIKNTRLTVSSIQVNFDDGGGFVTTAFNDTLSHTYSTIGNKRLIIKLTFTNGSSVQCYTKVNVTAIPNANNLYQPTNATIPFNPINNNHSGADITVQYSVNNTTPIGNRQFQKPFIVVEGFDMHDAAPLLMPDGYNYESFRKELNTTIFPNNLSFNRNLDNIASYDLIFVNWRDGTDDILRNTVVLEEIINWVNANKAPAAQQNVVMGISMGGLVSRYCLAKMTKAGIATQTRLLVTHDSPHRGANIPLGAQHLINDFANTRIFFRKLTSWIPLLRQAVILQKRPATIQQLIVRNNPDTYNSVEYNNFLAPNGIYRNMVTFSTNDPQPTYRFVATSAGSQCGVPVLQPSQNIAKTGGSAGFTFIFGAFGSGLKGSCIVNALPNGTASQQITYFKLVQKNTILWINFYTTLFLFQHNSPTGILGWDGCPAGITPISRGTGLSNLPPTYNSGPWFIPPFIFEYVSNFDGLQVAPAFSFLPTVSALDEDDITATSLYAPHVGAFYTPTNTTSLQTYVAQEEIIQSGTTTNNIEHTDFTSRNANWIFNEMENIGQPIDCDAVCSPTEIIGPSGICSSAVYRLNVPPTTPITWSISPSGIASHTSNGNNGNNERLVTRITDGTITLSATTNAATCSTTVSKIITVSNYTMDGNMYNSVNTTPVQFNGNGQNSYVVTQRGSWVGFTFNITTNTNLTNLKWYRDDINLTGTGNTFNTSVQASIYGYGTVFTSVRLEADAPCGKVRFDFPIQIQSLGWFYEPTVSPNPATDNINVNVKKVEYENAKEPTVELINYVKTANTTFNLIDNNTGAIIKNWQLKGIETTNYSFNIANVKNGLYTLQMERLGQKYNNQILISR